MLDFVHNYQFTNFKYKNVKLLMNESLNIAQTLWSSIAWNECYDKQITYSIKQYSLKR